MAAVVRPRRHSLSNPLVLDGLPFAPFPFEDVRFPQLHRRSSVLRKEPNSPVDSLLSPDFRFPQGDAAEGPALHPVSKDEDGTNGNGLRRLPLQRQRSKSMGARPSRQASPSFEDIGGLLALAQQRGLPGPLAPAPALVVAYCSFRKALQSLRVRCLTRETSVRGRAGPGLRVLVGAARPAELALLPVVFPAPRLDEKAAAVRLPLAPAAARQLTRRVQAAAAAAARAGRHLDRWQTRYTALGDWQAKIETRADDVRYLPRAVDVDRAALLAELEKEKERLLGDLVDRILPQHAHGVHARVQDIGEFLAQKGLFCDDGEPVMSAALPARAPGEKGEEPQQQEAGDQVQREEDAGDLPQRREVKQHGEEGRDASAVPKETAPRVDNRAVPRHGGSTSWRQKIRWAYLRLRYGSRRRWRRINHAAALDAFVKFQQDLWASMAAADASPANLRLYDKAEAWARWHAQQLDPRAPSSSPLSSETSEEGEEEDDDDEDEEVEDEDEDEDGKTVSAAVPSLVDVTFGDGDDDEWAAQVSKSIRRIGSSSNISHSGEMDDDEEEEEEEEEEEAGRSSRNGNSHSHSPLRTTRLNLDGAAAPGGSKRDSGVVGCATPTPVVEASGSCEDLMQRTGTITQRRRQEGKGLARV